MLPPVNLLNWREMQQQQKRQRCWRLLLLSGSVFLSIQGGLGAWSWHAALKHQVAMSNLQQQLVHLKQQAMKRQLTQHHVHTLAQLKGLQQHWQLQATYPWRAMKAVEASVLGRIYITQLTISNQVMIEGVAESVTVIESMTNHLQKQANVADVHIVDLYRTPDAMQHFQVQFHLHLFDEESHLSQVSQLSVSKTRFNSDVGNRHAHW